MNDDVNAQAQRLWQFGGRIVLALTVVVFGWRAALMDTGFGNLVEFLLGVAIGVVVVVASVLLVRLSAALLKRIPATGLVALIAALVAVVFLDAFAPAAVLRTLLDPDAWEWPIDRPAPLAIASIFAFILTIAFLVVALPMRFRGRRFDGLAPSSLAALFVSVILIGGLTGINVAVLSSDGEDPFPSDYGLLSGPAALPAHLAAPDPALPGAYPVETLSYGAGENPRRPEFGEGRDLESRSVDASPLLPDWKGVKKRMREWYWGFGLEDAPLNALVWAPEGAGPFPIALIVHGNHGMEEYSDPGYAYLGELLASRGIIAVSLDQNYINGTWSGDFRGKEMPARAWLMLEHLRLWRDWNATAGHRFEGRVDLDNIALIGHSRGGEAVSIAHAYNDLAYFPDDATVRFDYGFNIDTLVAVAQIDHRYERRMELEDVNFLALQGSYDSDESAFHGLRQFNRIELTGADYRLKAGIYIHGANHGQFNSIWGREDASPPAAWELNLAPLIPGEDQRQIAKVYIAAFLASTLQADTRYTGLFRDPRVAADWLPDHAYVQQFTDSTLLPLATFDEDLDVTTATAAGVALNADGFGLWREEQLKHRDERLQGTNALVLGWNETSEPAYTIDVPAGFWPDDANERVLSLAISPSTESPPSSDEDGDSDEDSEEEKPEVGAPRFTIEAYGEDGLLGRIESVDHAHLAPPLKVRFLKSERLNKERYKADWEPVLQAFEVPLSELAGERAADIRRLVIRFDREEPAVVIIDDIGVRRVR